MKQLSTTPLPAIVIGAGPIGLVAAAHLIMQGQKVLILEAGPSIASNLESYRHVPLFSRWRHNIDPVSAGMLEATGWVHPEPDAFPTAGEVIDGYFKPMAALDSIAPHIKFNHRVTDIARYKCSKVTTSGRESQPFVIRALTPEGVREYTACAVFDASGTWSQPNGLGGNGLTAIGEEQVSESIDYGMPDILGAQAHHYKNQSVLVLGAGHSAVGNLLALGELAEEYAGTQINWAIRRSDATKIFGKPPECGEPSQRAKLGLRLKALHDAGVVKIHTDFHVASVQRPNGKLHVASQRTGEDPARSIEADRIICATGARPDWDMTRELRLRYDEMLECTPTLAELIDPNIHSCGLPRGLTADDLAHPERSYFCIGAKSYGRAPNFLMVTGYEQAKIAVEAFFHEQSLKA